MARWWRGRKTANSERAEMSARGPVPVLGAPVIMIGRKELYECGFEFCGANIRAAFAATGQTIVLDDERDPPEHVNVEEDLIIRWLWINDEFLMEDINIYVEFELADGTLREARALDWDVVMALRKSFSDPANPRRTWHLGEIDEGYLLILATAAQLDDIAAHPDFVGYGVIDLTGAKERRRGAF